MPFIMLLYAGFLGLDEFETSWVASYWAANVGVSGAIPLGKHENKVSYKNGTLP